MRLRGDPFSEMLARWRLMKEDWPYIFSFGIIVTAAIAALYVAERAHRWSIVTGILGLGTLVMFLWRYEIRRA